MGHAEAVAEACDHLRLFTTFRPEAVIDRRRFDPAWAGCGREQQ